MLRIFHKCTKCKKYPAKTAADCRKVLTVKKVCFLSMGEGGKTYRARVVARLCPDCLMEDEVWNQPEYRMQKDRDAWEKE